MFFLIIKNTAPLVRYTNMHSRGEKGELATMRTSHVLVQLKLAPKSNFAKKGTTPQQILFS